MTKPAFKMNKLIGQIGRKVYTEKASETAREVTLKDYQTVKGANLDVAKNHELANSVKKPLLDFSKREICFDCKQYIPKPEDKFPYWSTSTDELWFLGTGIPIYFSFLKKTAIFLLLLSLFIVSALFIQSYFLYKKLDEFDPQREMHIETSTFVFGTSYAVSKFRIFYGFDFGVWLK